MEFNRGSLVDGQMPRGIAGVLECAEAEEEKVRRRASAAIKQLEGERDRELAALAEVIGRLRQDESPDSEPPKRPARRRPARRRSGQSPTQNALQRADQVLRFLAEEEGKVKFAEIKGALRLTDSMTAGALKRLVSAGRIEREGRGSSTRYFLSAAQASGAGIRAEPTRSGRILELVASRGSAGANELAQALGISVEEVERECGTLIADEHLRMASRQGTPVYVVLGRPE